MNIVDNKHNALSSIMAGVVIGIIDITSSISLAALLFSGELSVFLPQGIGIALFSTFLVCALLALLSHFRGVIAAAQDASIVILAVVTQHIATQVDDPTHPSTFVTIAVFIALSSLVTGIFFILLGRFKLGNVIRYIPYPVIGGFLGSVGIIMFQGAFSASADYTFSLQTLDDLFAMEMIQRWLPAVILALVIWGATTYFNHFLVLPSLLVAGVASFFIVLWASGHTVDQALAEGWLLGPFSNQTAWQPIFAEDLDSIHWEVISESIWHIPVIAMVSAIVLLLNISGLEIQNSDEIDINQELQRVGFTNLGLGATGGLIGYSAISLTALSWRLAGKSRLTGLVMALVFLVVLFFGFDAIAYFPKFVMGGLLLYLAITILEEWVYQNWFKMPIQEYLLMLVILFVVAFVSYLRGMVIGIFWASVLFAYNYSRLNLVQPITGKIYHSKVERPPVLYRELHEKGNSLLIYRLRGMVFFGSANSLQDQVMAQVKQPASPIRFVVLDFHQVLSIDSSAILTFIRLNQLLQNRHITLLFCGINAAVLAKIHASDFSLEPRPYFNYFEELDMAVEWYEEQLLQEMAADIPTDTVFGERLRRLFPNLDFYAMLLPHLEHLQLTAGEYLARQGEESDKLFWVESGRVDVQVETPDRTRRLRTGKAGAVMGEIAFYTGKARSASIVAAEDTSVYALSREKLTKLETEAPQLALKFHHIMAQMLSERLLDTTNSLNHYL